MTSKFCLRLIIMAFIIAGSHDVRAQNNSAVDVRKFEVAAEFSSLTFNSGQTEAGFGGRLTYNIDPHFALEAAGYFFPNKCNFCGLSAGRNTEGLFGVKAGKRFEKWGLFGKARPGLVSSSQGAFNFVANTTSLGNDTQFLTVQKRLTSFAVDVGGVLEFYPTKRIITRFDFGSTIIHYGRRTENVPIFNFSTGSYTLTPYTFPAETRGTLQFMAGVGFRF